MDTQGKRETPPLQHTGTSVVPAIELRALCKTFGTLQAVDQLTLEVSQGEIFGLLGPNGSGKTTTINLISGLSTPTGGEVQVMGYQMPRHARRIRQMLGAVPQETALCVELSSWDNLDFHADLFGMAGPRKKARIMQMLDLVQLQERQHSRVSTFSGGMKRRLALAQQFYAAFTNDIRRALPLSITSFYARAAPTVVTITPQESDAYPQDLGYIPFLSVPILVIGLMVGGMVQAGTAAAVEWEHQTVKELLLSPASRVAILLGKMLAAFLVALAGAAVVLAVLIVLMGIWPVHWGELIGFTLLILALFTAWGTLLGAWLKRRTPLATLAIGLCVPLFFLSGPFGPISFLD